MFGINQLSAAAGSISPGGDAEWNAYFGALRSNMNARWQKAVDSYTTLKNVRETLGLPFIVDNGTGEGGPGASAGAWNSQLEQQAVNLHAMTVLITGALDDVVSGKRRVGTLPDGDEWAIEKLPSDILKIDVKAPGVPVLVSAATGQPENVQGTVGALWTSAVIGVLVPGGGVYLTLRAIDALLQNTQEKTAQTIALRNGDLIKSGKATPEQVAALTKAEGQAATDLTKARAEEKNAGASDPTKWTPLVKTIVWGGAAIMGLWIVSKLVSGSGVAARAANPVEGNPIRTSSATKARAAERRYQRSLEAFEDGRHGRMTRNEHFELLRELEEKRDAEWSKVKVVGNPGMLSSGNWSSPPVAPRKYHLRRVHLDRGGYADKGRRYFGVGKPLYEYSSTDGDVHGYLRASSRKEAKQHLRDEQGGALFFNPLAIMSMV